MGDIHHIGTGPSTCIHVYMIRLHVWSATCVVTSSSLQRCREVTLEMTVEWTDTGAGHE